MTERHDPHAADSMVGPHGQPDDHGGDHGHDDHAHPREALGPLDAKAWSAAALGLAMGLAVAGAFVISLSP